MFRNKGASKLFCAHVHSHAGMKRYNTSLGRDTNHRSHANIDVEMFPLRP